MGDTCERCGRPKGISFNDIDAYKKCLGGAPCLERAYEREKARAEKAEAALTRMRADSAHEQAMHFKAETAADKLIKEKEAALAAARREIDAARDNFGAIEDEARLAIDGGGNSPAKAVRMIQGIALSALAAPAAGEEGKR